MSTFWSDLDDMLARRELVIDRPAGSHHPQHDDLVYPLDYGYLRGTRSADGEELDVWVGTDPSLGLVGLACAYDTVGFEVELKLLVGCTPADVDAVLSFNAPFMHYLFIPRGR